MTERKKIDMLHGRMVLVASCSGQEDCLCTIRSGCGSPNPFEAVAADGAVRYAFPAHVARELRKQGNVSNMKLVE